MAIRPNRAIPFGAAVGAGVLSVALIAGLSAGISVEEAKRKVYETKIGELKSELDTSLQIAQDINITPPEGKGFINYR